MPISRSAVRSAGRFAGYKAPTAPSGELLLFDGFDYEVGRTEPGSTANAKIFAQGWEGVKRQPDETGSFYVHTVTQAEMEAYCGHTGPLPGVGSRCVRIEAYNQPDGHECYFLAGDGSLGAIPANVWFQFWHFHPYGNGEDSIHQNRYKLLYPTTQLDGGGAPLWGPATWLIQMDQIAHGPYWTGSPMPDGRLFPTLRDMTEAGSPDYTLVGDDNDSKLGMTVPVEPSGSIPRNQWTLIKIHFDTSNSAQGIFEVWLRPYGGEWTKAADWRGGENGLIWNGFITTGHYAVKFPDTIGWTDDGTTTYLYFDDFAMATSESALPTYGD